MLFETENGTVTKYNGDTAETAQIPEGVTEIGEYAFMMHEELCEIILPEGVERISQHAFRGCGNLKKITLPTTLKSIHRFAFWECGELEEITLPDGLEVIGNSVFRGCEVLKKIHLPDSVRSVGESAFSDCYSLEEVRLSPKLTEIKKRVFSDCLSIRKIELPLGITDIDEYAFECCRLLKSINIPEGVKHIGRHAFDNCRSLTDIKIPSGVQTIGSSAFYRTPLLEQDNEFLILGDNILIAYKGEGKTAAIPEGVRVIGERAFAFCESLEHITIPESVVEIGFYAFENCTALKEVVLPKGLKKLGLHAFIGCTALEKAAVPQGIEEFGFNAFNGTALPEINSNEAFTVIGGTYLISYNGSESTPAIPSNIDHICDSAFSGNINMIGITLPDSVKMIGRDAFRWCSELREVTVPASVRAIGDNAFAGCDMLRANIFYEGEKTPGISAFAEGARLCITTAGKSFTLTLCDDLLPDSENSALSQEKLLNDFCANPCEKNFAKLECNDYKIPIAAAFLGEGEFYRAYLVQNIKAAVFMAIEQSDSDMLSKLLGLNALTDSDCSDCIGLASQQGKTLMEMELMRYRHEHSEKRSINSLIDEKLKL